MKTVCPRILYVDADENSGKIINNLILNADPPYDIALVSDKRNALYQVRTSTFDLYILDYGPTHDVDLCAEIRSHHPGTPILFLSDAVWAGERLMVLERGASDFLVKPDEIGRIGDTVGRLLGRSAPAGHGTGM